MAVRTSTTSGNASNSATWGGATLANGDIVIIATGTTVTFDQNYTLGSNASGIGVGITIQATDAVTFGTAQVSSGVTLTLRGFDTGLNAYGNVNRFAFFNPLPGSTIVFDGPSDWGAAFICNGNWTTNGVTLTIPASNINYNNASGTDTVYPGNTQPSWDVTPAGVGIFTHKITDNSGTLDLGPISNSTGTGIGTFGNSSFTITFGGFSGSTSTPVASVAAITNNGDYYLDHNLGLIWYKAPNAVLTIHYNFKYTTWFSWGVVATQNQTGNSVLVDNCVINYAGSNSQTTQGEQTSGGFSIDDKFSPAIDATRCARFTGNTFNYCTRPLIIYQSNTQGTATTAAHPMSVTGNTFNYTRANYASIFTNGGTFGYGYANYINFNSNVWYSYTMPFCGVSRGDKIGIQFCANTGYMVISNLLPPVSGFTSTGGSLVDSNNMIGFTIDGRAFGIPGNPTNGRNTYSNNIFSHAGRAGGIVPYTNVTGNKFSFTFHHGFVAYTDSCYISNITFTNNIVFASESDSDLCGGLTTSYNYRQWLDNIVFTHNTFDGGTRGIRFNDQETSTALLTRCSIINNIVSNSHEGIVLPADDANNVTRLALTQVDYNVDYNNGGNGGTPSNFTQCTFLLNGTGNYNTATKNIAGIYLSDPQGYTLPDSTPRSLVQNISGTNGTNKAITLAWSGGASQNLVAFQGTATGGTIGDPGDLPTIIDSTAPFNIDLRGYQVMIVAGTGAGQFGMVFGTTSTTTLTVVPNTANSQWPVAPDATSVYLVLKSHVVLADSGGANTIIAGVYSPAISTTNATNTTDANISMTKNWLNADPQFVNRSGAVGNLTPMNQAFATAASDGTFLGALPIQAALSAIGWMPFWTGDNF